MSKNNTEIDQKLLDVKLIEQVFHGERAFEKVTALCLYYEKCDTLTWKGSFSNEILTF